MQGVLGGARTHLDGIGPPPWRHDALLRAAEKEPSPTRGEPFCCARMRGRRLGMCARLAVIETVRYQAKEGGGD